jgi:hypothetical protein
MSEPKIAVGSFPSWLFFRCFSLVTVISGLVLMLANLHPFPSLFFCIGAFILLIGLGATHDQIYGVASEDGIQYRQFFASRFLKWEDIATISWAHAGLVYFHLKSRGRSHKALTAQSLQNRPWAELLSEEPEVIRWLTLVRPTAADGIEIRYPQATLPPLFRWNPFKASRIAQFMFVLAVMILIFSMIYARR